MSENPKMLPGEVDMLARQVAAAFGEKVEGYKKYWQLSPAEAVAKAREPASPQLAEAIRDQPPEEITWDDLETLSRRDQAQTLRFWDKVKAAAWDEVRAGHAAGRAAAGYRNSPWDLAIFYGILRELEDGWQPRNGVERQLLQTMALAQAALVAWMGRLAGRTTSVSAERTKVDGGTAWTLPTVCESDAVEQAAAMADRFNRMVARTLRTLRDLRRYPAVFVQNAGQVNVGAQQVNLAG